jgi:hypothetical protein
MDGFTQALGWFALDVLVNDYAAILMPMRRNAV